MSCMTLPVYFRSIINSGIWLIKKYTICKSNFIELKDGHFEQSKTCLPSFHSYGHKTSCQVSIMLKISLCFLLYYAFSFLLLFPDRIWFLEMQRHWNEWWWSHRMFVALFATIQSYDQWNEAITSHWCLVSCINPLWP